MLVGFKWGVIVGVAAYLVEFVLALLYAAMTGSGPATLTDRPTLLIPVCLGYFALLFACSAAGFYAGRETGRAGLGALAGGVVWFVQYILGRIYTPAASSHATSTPTHSALGPVAAVLAALVAPLLFLALTACMGWLGGRPGAQQYARRHKASGEHSDVIGPPSA
jgi:hypothetical protein